MFAKTINRFLIYHPEQIVGLSQKETKLLVDFS
jgi:hypothetical protein